KPTTSAPLTTNKPANQCGTHVGVMDGKDLEKRGRSGPQTPRAFRAEEPHDYADPFAAGCHRLRRPQNGKGRVDTTSLFAKEVVTFLAPQRESNPANPMVRRTRRRL